LAQIFVSPRQRAGRTFELLFGREGKLPPHEVTDEVREWDYGEYEGLVTSAIRKINPTWEIFLNGLAHGDLFVLISHFTEQLSRGRKRGGDECTNGSCNNQGLK
jgi:Histidine phosphatase superfamily (branch 1)